MSPNNLNRRTPAITIPKVPGSNPAQGGILFKAMLAYTYPYLECKLSRVCLAPAGSKIVQVTAADKMWRNFVAAEGGKKMCMVSPGFKPATSWARVRAASHYAALPVAGSLTI